MNTTKIQLASISRCAAAFGHLLRAAAILAVACCAPIASSQPFGMDSSRVEGVTQSGPQVLPIKSDRDLRSLPPPLRKAASPSRPYRPLRQPPPDAAKTNPPTPPPPDSNSNPGSGSAAPMPAPSQSFAGLSFADTCLGGQCGGGWPPDANGDVGPNHYIQAVNDAYAVYSKSGALLASFTEDQLWSGIGTSPCNGNSQGDPVVLYDAMADRWILTHFAFAYSGQSPIPPYYQCIAVSQTGDPVAGGWFFYPLQMDTGGSGAPAGTLNDYSKFGVWADCLYMTANGFSEPADSFVGSLYASFNRADLYSGSALRWSVGFTVDAFSMIPSNLSGKAASALPPGTPNYLVSESRTFFEFEVRKFTSGTNCAGGGTLGAPVYVSQASYLYPGNDNVAQPNTTTKLDNLGDRLMQKVQYRKVGSSESLWVVHTVQASASSTVRPQWAQIDVTGGVVAPTPAQQQIYVPDATLNRWMGSLAVDGQGNMALGYSTSNGTSPNFPSIAYSGRLASDPANTLPQTETQLIAGLGSQANTCGGAPCSRWGDYSAMSVDPVDDCTFWYTNQYYDSQANGNSGHWQTRIGSFKFASCRSPTTTALVSSANPATLAAPVTFTATVTGIAPSGTVQFADGGVSIVGCSAVAVSGAGNVRTASCSTTSLTGGIHAITATYGGDAVNAVSSSSALSQVINAPFANLGFESPGLAGSYAYGPSGAAWTFTGAAGIAGNGNAFTSGNTAAPQGVQVGVLQLTGSASQTASLAAGQYTVSFKAAQRGNLNSGMQTIQVLVDGAVIGQYRPVDATYAFYRSFPVNLVSTGPHTLVLQGAGSGGSDFTGFVDDVRIEAAGSVASSSTALTSSLNPAAFGASITFTATVTGLAPSGTVQFADGGTPIGGCATVALVGSGNVRTATCTTAQLPTGSRSISAAYSGDPGNGASTSGLLTETINLGSFSNLGFEAPNVAGGYQYTPTGALWSFSGGSGVTGNANAFTGGNPNAPEGVEVAFIQGAGRISQAANVVAGQYVVSFRAAQRGNYQLGTQVIAVVVDGVTVGQFQPPGNGYTLYQTPAFVIPSTGTHTLELVGVGSGGADFTAFVDDVYVGAPLIIAFANLGFETPNLAGGYQYAPTGATWAFSGASGITGNGTAFTGGNPNAPEGIAVGFVQLTGRIAQSATLGAGQYVVRLLAAQRGNVQVGTQSIAIVIDGATVGQFAPPSTAYSPYQTPTFTIASSGVHTLELVGVGSGGTDFTAFVDSVQIGAP